MEGSLVPAHIPQAHSLFPTHVAAPGIGSEQGLAPILYPAEIEGRGGGRPATAEPPLSVLRGFPSPKRRRQNALRRRSKLSRRVVSLSPFWAPRALRSLPALCLPNPARRAPRLRTPPPVSSKPALPRHFGRARPTGKKDAGLLSPQRRALLRLPLPLDLHDRWTRAPLSFPPSPFFHWQNEPRLRAEENGAEPSERRPPQQQQQRHPPPPLNSFGPSAERLPPAPRSELQPGRWSR